MITPLVEYDLEYHVKHDLEDFIVESGSKELRPVLTGRFWTNYNIESADSRGKIGRFQHQII